MKIAALIARILLGLIFVVFGLNPFLKYIPMQMPPGTAGQFLTVLFVSHFVYVVGAAQVIGGVLLLVSRYVPLALTILGPVIVSILASRLPRTCWPLQIGQASRHRKTPLIPKDLYCRNCFVA